MPASPVHALAQPLLTATACAMPPDEARCAFDTTTGAATALFVVNTAAAGTGRSATSNAKSSGAAGPAPRRLMPQATPAARNPRGAVTPPGTVCTRGWPTSGDRDMAVRRTRLGAHRGVERQQH